MAQWACAIRRSGIEDTRVVGSGVVLRHAVQEHIHVRADVQVAQLESAGEGEDERDVFLHVGLLADGLDVGRGSGWETAGERCVVVDEELEEVEERVGYHRDGAVDFAFVAVLELEGLVGFFAGGEGDPFDFVVGVFNVFACFAGELLASAYMK